MSKKFRGTKKLIASILAVAILASVATTFAIASTARRNVSGQQGGVNVVVDGQRLNLPAADEPIVIDGRTFLPVRALADATGLGIEWDGATSTVSISTDGTAPTTTLPAPVPAPTTLLQSVTRTSNNISVRPDMIIRGVAFQEPVVYTHWRDGAWSSTSELDGRFTTLNATVGRIEQGLTSSASITFSEGNRIIERIAMSADDAPRNVTVDVTGVRNLTIRVDFQDVARAGGFTYWAIAGNFS